MSNKYYWKHREKRLAAKKLYGIKNREVILQRKKIYYRSNLDRIVAKRNEKRDRLAAEIHVIQD